MITSIRHITCYDFNRVITKYANKFSHLEADTSLESLQGLVDGVLVQLKHITRSRDVVYNEDAPYGHRWSATREDFVHIKRFTGNTQREHRHTSIKVNSTEELEHLIEQTFKLCKD